MTISAVIVLPDANNSLSKRNKGCSMAMEETSMSVFFSWLQAEINNRLVKRRLQKVILVNRIYLTLQY
jgi:hypothetical protein